jgi:NAD(P)-dependent dehydrogenase (short-subunit alcohol dehydrogenase family)
MPGGMNTNIASKAPFAQNLHEEGQKLLDVVVDALATSISDTREVANLCAFLASNEASALNGALITVDKGQTTVL